MNAEDVQTDKTSPGLRALQRFREEGGQISPPKSPWEKLAEHPTLKRAINAKCCDCMGWGIDEERPPGLVQDIRNCTSPRRSGGWSTNKGVGR